MVASILKPLYFVPFPSHSVTHPQLPTASGKCQPILPPLVVLISYLTTAQRSHNSRLTSGSFAYYLCSIYSQICGVYPICATEIYQEFTNHSSRFVHMEGIS